METATKEISIREAQERVDEWIQIIGGGYFSELTNLALLMEETGELARLIARKYGDQIAKAGDCDKDMAEEMADILWVLICLANQTGIDLTDAFRQTIIKKSIRDKERFKDRQNS